MSWLQSEESGDLGTFFARFLDRQGHRGIREVKKHGKDFSNENNSQSDDVPNQKYPNDRSVACGP